MADDAPQDQHEPLGEHDGGDPCGGEDGDLDVDGSMSKNDAAWSRREQARNRQITIGKARPEYRRYTTEVPRACRTSSQPTTPDPRARVSKRTFDRSLGEWRRRLHEFDATPGVAAGNAQTTKHQATGNASSLQRAALPDGGSSIEMPGTLGAAVVFPSDNEQNSSTRLTRRQRAGLARAERSAAAVASAAAEAVMDLPSTPREKKATPADTFFSDHANRDVPAPVVRIRLADQLLKEEAEKMCPFALHTDLMAQADAAQLYPLPLPFDFMGQEQAGQAFPLPLPADVVVQDDIAPLFPVPLPTDIMGQDDIAPLFPLPLPTDIMAQASAAVAASAAYGPWHWSFPPAPVSVSGQLLASTTPASAPPALAETLPSYAGIVASPAIAETVALAATSIAESSPSEVAPPQTPQRESFAARRPMGTIFDVEVTEKEPRGSDSQISPLKARFPSPPPLPRTPGAPLTPNKFVSPKPEAEILGRASATPFTNWAMRTPSPERFYWSSRVNSSPWRTQARKQPSVQEAPASALWMGGSEFWNTPLPASLPFSDETDQPTSRLSGREQHTEEASLEVLGPLPTLGVP
eukprot:TRINITY_DN5304_c0_g1_i1.p1 TRINITY_DN5304_c0_g1~~TRINITY_DN5304_c0_g1_i1.p1  ORF type:complete len:580 (-),score=111.00 TRINITY_DN5304_c0_g1_i1:55-1794(-)